MKSQKFVEMCYCSCAAAQNRVLERQAAVKCVRFRNYKQGSSAVRFRFRNYDQSSPLIRPFVDGGPRGWARLSALILNDREISRKERDIEIDF